MKTAGSGKGCERCREWQEHYYWEHMDVDKIRFFKLMTGDFQERIRIPEKFASNFIRQMDIAEGLDLKAPSGETWRVGVSKVADELFLGSGWGDFAEANALQENDLLLFTCSGRSSFEVLIFDASGYERLSPFFTGRMCKHFDEMVMGQQVELYSPSVDEDSDDDTSVPSQLVGSPHKASTSRKCSVKSKPRKQFSESPSSSSCDVKLESTEEEEESDRDRHTDPDDYYYSKAAGELTGDERQEIIGLASNGPGNPVFVTVLKRTHLQSKNNFLIIPFKFAADHLQRRPPEVLLYRPNREEWRVRYYHSSHTRGFNCQRWVRFVRDNGLRKGDVCVFELIKASKSNAVTMAVHVARRRKKDGRFVTVG
uniref:Uncharacterized protein n=1 Tax=Avena sativa TaxID=4498 RepID=A0ACD5U083_AVESA